MINKVPNCPPLVRTTVVLVNSTRGTKIGVGILSRDKFLIDLYKETFYFDLHCTFKDSYASVKITGFGKVTV